jgi:hypothetical protein
MRAVTNRGTRVVGPPRSFVAGGRWPTGRTAAGAPDGVRYAKAITKNLKRAMDGRSVAGLAADADLHRSTLYDILSGRTWPDLVSLAKLETALETRLWPD